MMHSVVIITRGRPCETARLLDALARQTRLPDEVLIVDGSETADYELLREAVMQFAHMRILHIASRAGIALQRNIGMERAEGDILTFFDDDSVPAPEYCAAVIDAFSADTGVAAVAGVLANASAASGLEYLFRSLFLLQTGRGANAFRRSGFPDLDPSRASGGACEVEIAASGGLSWRRTAAAGLRIDPSLFSGVPVRLETGRCFGEDVWLTAHLRERGRIVLLPAASYRHEPSPHARDDSFTTQALYVYAMRMLSRWKARGAGGGLLRRWALFGQGQLNLLQTLRYWDAGYVRGYLRAMRVPLRIPE